MVLLVYNILKWFLTIFLFRFCLELSLKKIITFYKKKHQRFHYSIATIDPIIATFLSWESTNKCFAFKAFLLSVYFLHIWRLVPFKIEFKKFFFSANFGYLAFRRPFFYSGNFIFYLFLKRKIPNGSLW